MKHASISEAKNQLSALLDRVRHGATVVIEDRGVPIARLEPIVGAEGSQGRLARLERQGLVRRPARRLPKHVLATRPPQSRGGVRATDVLLEERRNGR